MTLGWYKVVTEYYVPADSYYQAILMARIISTHRNPDRITDVRKAEPCEDLLKENMYWYCPDCGIFFGKERPLLCPECGEVVRNTMWFIDNGYDPEKGTLEEQAAEYFGSMRTVKG